MFHICFQDIKDFPGKMVILQTFCLLGIDLVKLNFGVVKQNVAKDLELHVIVSKYGAQKI